MTTIVHDTTEAVCLCEEYNLYLKPIVKVTVSVALPQLKLPGKSISNWEVMERVKAMVAPEQFSALRISKSTMDFIRFEGEVENKGVVKSLLARLDGKTIKLSGFTDILKVRALENKMDFPTRHDWDSFFRDAKDMNETLPGERPDTIHLEGLPCRWFTRRDGQHPERPHEAVLQAVFQGFGPVRQVDIPMLDPYREEMLDKNFNTFTFGGHLNFDAYVQFQEYGGFTRAMDALRGMKLMLKGEDGKAVACNIKVAFDTNKHLSEAAIKKRQQERLKLQELERQREEQKRKEKEEEERRREEERKQKEVEEEEKERKKEERLRKREQKVREREEKRNLKKVKKRREEDQKRLQMKIATEERRLLLAQRNLESIRLIAELLARAKVVKQQEAEQERAEREAQEREEQARQQVELARLQRLEACRRRQEEELQRVETEKERALDLQRKERELRERLLGNLLKKTSGGAGDTPPRDEASLLGSDAAVRGVLAPVNGLKAEERQPSRSGVRSRPAEKRRTSGGREARRREGAGGGREEENRRAAWQGGREGGRRSSEPGRRRRSSRSHSRERRRHSRSRKRSHSRRRSRERRSDGRRSSQGRGHGRRRGSRSSSRDRSQSSSGRSHSGGRSRWHSRHRDDSQSRSGSHGDGRSRRRSRSGSRDRSRPRRH